MNIKSWIKRYYPISNRYFFAEMKSLQREVVLGRNDVISLHKDIAAVSQNCIALKDEIEGVVRRCGGIRHELDIVGKCNGEIRQAVANAAALHEYDRELSRLQRTVADINARESYIVRLLEDTLHIPMITAIELYFIEVEFRREFSFGAWPTRLHCCVRVRSGEHCGWGEIRLANDKDGNEKVFADVVRAMEPWRGVSVCEALHMTKTRRGRTPDRILEAMEMSLIDLSARLQNKSALAYLDLPSVGSVPSLRCILQKDDGKAMELAAQLAHSHLKIKLFGDNVHDYNLIKAVRSVIPQDCFLVGDVNMGYGNAPGGVCSSDLIRALGNLRDAGLNACEDPANLSWTELAKLQAKLPDLAIIPDEPMRPSYKVLNTVEPVPGHIYNLHPNCMGSVTATIELARKLKRGGAEVMLGDDSLIGPACCAWQQVAIGVGAAWCEALEKPEESTAFIDCVRESPMEITSDGRVRIMKDLHGFGLTVDCDKLATRSVSVVTL